MREAKTWEEERELREKQLRTGSKSIVWVDSDECLYRGMKIRRHDDTPVGYGGRYSVKYLRAVDRKVLTDSFSKMSEAKEFIDSIVKE